MPPISGNFGDTKVQPELGGGDQSGHVVIRDERDTPGVDPVSEVERDGLIRLFSRWSKYQLRVSPKYGSPPLRAVGTSLAGRLASRDREIQESENQTRQMFGVAFAHRQTSYLRICVS